MKIKITKKLPTDPENRPEVGGVYEVVRQAPGQYGPILFIKAFWAGSMSPRRRWNREPPGLSLEGLPSSGLRL